MGQAKKTPSSKIIIAVGGTGGHLFPAQTVVQELFAKHPELDILFVGGGLRSNRYFTETKYPFQEISSATPYRKGFLRSLCKILKGIGQSLKILYRFKPDLLLGFGSFHTFPILVAAVLYRVPFILFESNLHPGRVNRLFAKKALFTAVQFAESQKNLRGRTVTVDFPLRIAGKPVENYFPLDPDKKTILIFGGSQGADFLNEVGVRFIEKLFLENPQIQVLHFAGDETRAAALRSSYAAIGVRALVKGFEKRMDLAWKVADLAITRAGAATVSEMLHYAVPTLFIPYPHAAESHQEKNALFIQDEVEGAVCLSQSQIGESFSPVPLLKELLGPKGAYMRAAIHQFNREKQPQSLSSLVEETLLGSSTRGKHYHFIGIGGIGMSALAHILLQKGAVVTGTDLSVTPITKALIAQGAKLRLGHTAAIPSSPHAVIYTTAVQADNPEYQKARQRDLPLIHRSELLAELIQPKRSLLIAGTHGKTTTTALLAYLLVQAGKDPSYAIGGLVPALATHGKEGKGDYFVAEADESDGSFLEYPGWGAILTNIDNDHLDYWKSEEALKQGFVDFTKDKKLLFWCSDDPVLSSLKLKGISYGLDPKAEAWIRRSSSEKGRTSFDLCYQGKSYSAIFLALSGLHNIRNAAAVFAMALSLDIEEEVIRRALEQFSGVQRRLEKKGEIKGIAVYDDYAHHPTEIAATLQAARSLFEKRRIIAVFQPHRYTRTRDCFLQAPSAFVEAFTSHLTKEDRVILTPIYPAGEKPIPGVETELLVPFLKEKSPFIVDYVSYPDLLEKLLSILSPGDLILTLGAGSITEIGPLLLQTLAQEGK